MKLAFANRQVTGMLTILPANERTFMEEMANYDFPEKRSLKLKETMGYDRRRIVSDGVCSSDLAVAGFKHLFDKGHLVADEIDALIVVTQTPDYLIPGTSHVIHGRLGLHRDVFCLDLNQGCAGFVIGVMQAFTLLEQEAIKKVALVNVDVLSRKVSPRDRNSYPLTGDAASITIIESTDLGDEIYGFVKTDGVGHDALMIPAGGMRLPSDNETRTQEDVGDGNFRSKDNLRMDGTAVFNFVQTEVPPMIEELLEFAGKSDKDIDYYIFHQPNRFMLHKLAQKMKVDFNKVPSNVVEEFGNSSGVTIPVAITSNFAERLEQQSFTVCLAGFGVGLTWASLQMSLGPLEFCDSLSYE